MEGIDVELDFEVDLDDILNNTCLDRFLDNEDLRSALEEVSVGCDDDYERKLIEQKKKREEYLQFKEQRRRESKEERLRTALFEKRELEEQLQSNSAQNEFNQRKGRKPQRQRSKPMQRIDTNVCFNAINTNERITKRRTLNNNTTGDQMAIHKKIKREPMDSNNKNFGLTTVLIRNLSPETNEFVINALGQTIGKVLGVCIALEEGVRKALVRFESPVDALLFQRKHNNYSLGSTLIKTTLIP